MNNQTLLRSLIAGLIALAFGLLVTFAVAIMIPTGNLRWSLIAVGWASFFGGAAGYLAGAVRRR